MPSNTPEESVRTEDELRIAEQQMSAILTIAADAIISLDEKLRITVFNDGAVAIFGYPRHEVIGQQLDILIPHRFHQRHHSHVEDFERMPVAAKKMGERQEIFARRKDGSEFPAEASIAKQEIGGRRVFMVVVRDVTERNEIQAQLARVNSGLEIRVAERTRELEEEIRRREEAQIALIQSQRMEAFGQLTGGIAHDFNNLLTIVTGNLELLAESVGGQPGQAYLKRATDAADMGASLTRRLLSFARRQRLTPQILNLNDLVTGLTEILQRSLGEPVRLETDLAPDLWKVRADASEVENAILNLALNARDAMPGGGRLLIATKNVAHGGSVSELRARDHVLISVADTGDGMTPDILARAIEPFFTTKGPGRGTGLGLSTVYGFVKQSGGYASIVSAPGSGTTVCLYLPKEEQVLGSPSGAAREQVPMSQNNETVLVVEDNPEVRELTLQRVEGLGYVAMEAESGAAAIKMLGEGASPDVILSDIVMAGGVSGFDLASWVARQLPHISIVLATGYAPEEMKRDPAELADVQILRKPYKRLDLAVALQAALKGSI
ncbi:MAG: PAS domain S-box protein [Hyphomicrobiaceae bacterium]|nr:PAS domain S-box protein [Hyphomicrobiaceae bacterium]